MPIVILMHTVDPSLSRLDSTLLSDQAMMGIVFEDITFNGEKVYRNANDDWTDVCEWESVKCDRNENVTKYDEIFISCSGTLNLSYLPQRMTYFSYCIESPNLYGTIETKLLPRAIENFNLSQTQCNGTVNMATFPPDLEHVNLGHNHFGGPCELSDLPEKLRNLYLECNAFEGCITLEYLPNALRNLDLSQNRLHGTLMFDKLPASMRALVLAENNFSGDFVLKRVPPAMKIFVASHTLFSGTARVGDLGGCKLFLKDSKVSNATDFDGRQHPQWNFIREETYTEGLYFC